MYDTDNIVLFCGRSRIKRQNFCLRSCWSTHWMG